MARLGKDRTSDEALVQAILKQLNMAYTDFPLIWAEKFKWQRVMWNEFDFLGMAQRICRDVTNMVLSEPVRIWTPSEYINNLIERDLYGRLQLNSVLSKNINQMMAIGDMVMSVYVSPLDGMMEVNFIPGQNVIPISYNNHEVTEIAWFQKEKFNDKVYVTMVKEGMFKRETFLFEFDGGTLQPIDYGTPLWFRVCGKTNPVIEFKDAKPYKRFAWISTGLTSPRWIDTPYHNSFIWPLTYIEQIKKDWKDFNTEFARSEKCVFIAPDLIRRSTQATDENGFALNVKKADMHGGFFQCVDLAEDKIKEWVPQIRYPEFSQKIQFDLQMWTQAVGLGNDMYKFDYPKIEMTATQTLLTHNDAYRTINNIKYNLTCGLQTIVYALIQYWFENGLIPQEEYIKVIEPSDVEIQFDDGVFINKDQRIDLGIRVLGSASTLPGMRNIDQYTFLTDFCGYSKKRALDIMNKCFNEFSQAMMIQFGMQQQAAESENKEKKEEKK